MHTIVDGTVYEGLPPGGIAAAFTPPPQGLVRGFYDGRSWRAKDTEHGSFSHENLERHIARSRPRGPIWLDVEIDCVALEERPDELDELASRIQTICREYLAVGTQEVGVYSGVKPYTSFVFNKVQDQDWRTMNRYRFLGHVLRDLPVAIVAAGYVIPSGRPRGAPAGSAVPPIDVAAETRKYRDYARRLAEFSREIFPGKTLWWAVTPMAHGGSGMPWDTVLPMELWREQLAAARRHADATALWGGPDLAADGSYRGVLPWSRFRDRYTPGVLEG